MNRYKHHELWLSLPAVLVVGYLAIFQPGPASTHAASTAAYNDAGPVQVTALAKSYGPDTVVSIASATTLPVPSVEGQRKEEVARDREFINYAFPLLSTWKLQELKPLLADATIDASTDEELNEVMAVLDDRLGELKYFETPKPVATRTEVVEGGEARLQHYQFIAYYEAGEAAIDLILRKQLTGNSLYSFNIHVPN